MSQTHPFILVTVGVLLLFGCSKEAVTSPKGLAGATAGCFSASYSKANNLHPKDLGQANQKFELELYSCIAWNVLGDSAQEGKKTRLSDLLQQQCPSPGLESIDKKAMVWCLMEGAAPFVQQNHDRLMSGKSE
jgi:hypothetical protein